jgi:2-C-methyl-D-erythritol 4-phosphate cytidylyltransferase / 2-C-methyl-D-erythritol 2,4-cyclodiphosphate synthase
MTRPLNLACAVIVAGGQGLRAGGDIAKQWRTLGGKRVVDWSLDVLRSHPGIGDIVLVTPGDTEGAWPEGVRCVGGGATRTASVRAGLAALNVPAEAVVLIHDAARPGLTHAIIDALLAAMATADASAPALPVADALKRAGGAGLISVAREGLLRVQTPQAFRLGLIRRALAEAEGDLADDLAALEQSAARITLVAGDIALSKLTHPEDFAMLERLLAPRAPRVGKGFDVHGFEPGDHVTLCGVAIPHSARLEGHSDADAAWHALTDAILGAAALGDIGDHFPPSEPRWKDADSGIFLKHAQALARAAGWNVASCDITVICEAPKVKPHRDAMRARTAALLGLPLDAVSVKATTTEGLGFTGRREGIAAEAIAVLVAV